MGPKIRPMVVLATTLLVAGGLVLVPASPAAAWALPFEARVTVAMTASGATSTIAADIDGDGDVDLASASGIDDIIAWYVNDGTPLDDGWAKVVVSDTADVALAVVAADIDGDGDIDLASASLADDTIAWYVNDGTPLGDTWDEISVTTVDEPQSVVAADIDGDGDIDLASASYSGGIAWYQNDGTPLDPAWTPTAVTAVAFGALSVTAADIDGDGDVDLASASQDSGGIAWHENDGTPSGAGWTTTMASVVDGDEVQSVVAADIDGDGDVDLASASYTNDRIVWYQNDGTPLGAGWTATTVDAASNGARSVTAGDADGDGDVDLAAASFEGASIAWYENDGSPLGADWTTVALADDAQGARWVTFADIDGDGGTDLASAEYTGGVIGWYPITVAARIAS